MISASTTYRDQGSILIPKIGFVFLLLIHPIFLLYSNAIPAIVYFLLFSIAVPIFFSLFFLVTEVKQRAPAEHLLVASIAIIACLSLFFATDHDFAGSRRSASLLIDYLGSIGNWIVYYFVGYYIFSTEAGRRIFDEIFGGGFFWLFVLFMGASFYFLSFNNLSEFILGYSVSSDVSVIGLSEAVLLLLALKAGVCIKNGQSVQLITLIFLQFLFYSRTAFFSLLSAVALGILIFGTGRQKLRSLLVLGLFSSLVLYVISFLVPVPDLRQFSWIFDASMLSSLASRLAIFENAWFVVANSPVLGAPLWQVDFYNDAGHYTHNIFSYLVQFGLVVFSLLILLLLRTLKYVANGNVLVVGFVATLISTLFSRSFFYPNIWFFIGSLYGVSQFIYRREHHDRM